VGDGCLELCVSRWWASLGEVALDVQLTFHGAQLCTSTPTMHGGEGVARFDVISPIRTEEISPSVTLETAICPLRPTEHKIKCLSQERDCLKDNRQIYAIELTYNFHLHKGCEVTPDCALLSNFLYESEYESQLWMLYDSNKQFIASGDAYPGSDSMGFGEWTNIGPNALDNTQQKIMELRNRPPKYMTKLEKNDFTLILQVRHEKRDMLEKLKDLVVLIKMKPSSSLSLDVYPTWAAAVAGGKKVGTCTAQRGMRLPLFVRELPEDKFPKGCGPGWFFTGNITLAKDDPAKSKSGAKFRYFVSEMSKSGNSKSKKKEKAEASKDGSKDSSKFSQEAMDEAVRDLMLQHLAKGPASAVGQLQQEMVTSHPAHPPTHLAIVAAIEADKDMDKACAWQATITACEAAVGCIDTEALQAYTSLKADHRPEAATIKSDMDKKKSWLVEALVKKGVAQCELLAAANTDSPGSTEAGEGDVGAGATDRLAEVNRTFEELSKWLDVASDKQSFPFAWRHAAANGQLGRAARLVVKQQEDKHSQDLEAPLIQLYKKLGWSHCAEYLESSQCVRYPSAYRNF